MRASRLVSILLLLQTRGRMTAQELAETLEVSVRTIYRDVSALHTAGVPLYGDPGADGGYQLLGGYRTRLTGLNADEAKTLFLGGVPGVAAELGLGTVMATARLKLQAALPAELADNATRIGERFHLDAPGWYYDPQASPHLTAEKGTPPGYWPGTGVHGLGTPERRIEDGGTVSEDHLRRLLGQGRDPDHRRPARPALLPSQDRRGTDRREGRASGLGPRHRRTDDGGRAD